jgi:uncharacterized membrane protein YgdD (TMEM256/DUF423 family)
MSGHSSSPNYLVAAAALSALIGIAIGGYGAHGLNANESLTGMWETGVTYQIWHALSAFATSWLASTREALTRKIMTAGGWFLLLGSLSFSGSLYSFIINGILPVLMLAPIGGTVMILGWGGIVFGALRLR